MHIELLAQAATEPQLSRYSDYFARFVGLTHLLGPNWGLVAGLLITIGFAYYVAKGFWLGAIRLGLVKWFLLWLLILSVKQIDDYTNSGTVEPGVVVDRGFAHMINWVHTVWILSAIIGVPLLIAKVFRRLSRSASKP